MLPTHRNPTQSFLYNSQGRHWSIEKYVKPEERHIMNKCKSIINGPQVSLPDGSAMKTLETGILPLNNFLLKMTKAGNILTILSWYVFYARSKMKQADNGTNR